MLLECPEACRDCSLFEDWMLIQYRPQIKQSSIVNVSRTGRIAKQLLAYDLMLSYPCTFREHTTVEPLFGVFCETVA